MALQKTIQLPSGVSGNYIRLSSIGEWDPIAKSASFHFALYLSQASRAAGCSPLIANPIAKLRLCGAKFDQYASAENLSAASIYAAAKVEPLVSDFGASAFSGAEDV